MKKLLLEQEDLIDFELYGLITSYNDSPQLVYHLNHSFATRFQRCSDLDVKIDDQLTFYPVFEWEDPQTGNYFNIIKNIAYMVDKPKTENKLASMFDVTPVLIPNFREYNYLLKLSGDGDDELPITENSFIQKISKLRTEKVKWIERLIF